MKVGKLIAVEGLDGSGKSTLIIGLQRRMEEAGQSVEVTKEPTDGVVGQLIRTVLRGENKLGHAELQLLFIADRVHHHWIMIDQAIASGKNVITDRHALSTISYGAAMGLDQEWLEKSNEPFLNKIDVGLYVDVPPEVAVDRLKKRGAKLELFEKLELLQKIHAAYKRSLENPRINPPMWPKWFVLDGALEPRKLADEAYAKIRQLL